MTSGPGKSTINIWGGEEREFLDGATQVPVVHSVSFGYPDLDSWLDVALGKAEGHIYGRNTNPTVSVFEEKVRLLEGGEAATSASTGSAAALGQRRSTTTTASIIRNTHLVMARRWRPFISKDPLEPWPAANCGSK